MSRSIKVEINPTVFKWLRENSGWTHKEIAKKLNVSEELIQNIENKKPEITLTQLNKISILFKRPLASFLHNEPKKEKLFPKDYRLLPNKQDKFDKKTILVMRKTRYLQKISKDLFFTKEELFEINKHTIKENPKILAKKYRNLFKLTDNIQKKFKTSYNFFNYLRDILEQNNILVFQFSMPIDDARGFVLIDDFPKIIVVNTKDSIEARIFTLMHEFAHILLGESVIDIPKINFVNDPIEKWCNNFASGFLLTDSLLDEITSNFDEFITNNKVQKKYSQKYKVSKAMIYYNLYKNEKITLQKYNEFINKYNAENILVTKKSKSNKGGGVPIDQKRISEVGNKFVSLVADNYDSKKITYADALDYLSIKSKHFDKIINKVKK